MQRVTLVRYEQNVALIRCFVNSIMPSSFGIKLHKIKKYRSAQYKYSVCLVVSWYLMSEKGQHFYILADISCHWNRSQQSFLEGASDSACTASNGSHPVYPTLTAMNKFEAASVIHYVIWRTSFLNFLGGIFRDWAISVPTVLSLNGPRDSASNGCKSTPSKLLFGINII